MTASWADRGLLKLAFPEADIEARHVNATQKMGLRLEERLEETRDALGIQLYERVIELNKDDMFLYRSVIGRYKLGPRIANDLNG